MPEKITPTMPFALSMGPQRAGTSWLDRYLRSRGDVCLPEEVKEIFFFDRNFDRGYGFYKSHFLPKDSHVIGMEITATSFDCLQAPQRVFKTFGKDVRLICPLRHPVVRSYSLYLHYLRYGIVSGSLQEAVQQVPQIIESSHYATHLNRWCEYYDKKNITFIFQEELESNQAEFVKKICSGLGIPIIPPEEDVQGKYNITTYSKFGPVARFAQNTADFLRKNRLYFIINIAKNLGVKRIIFGKERPDANKKNIPIEDKIWLFDQLGDEVEKFEKLVGYKISYWHEIEKNKNNDR
ncbi:MAG: sulfotransferase domain-containing protein [Alphaproteobacteria bacterium]|nr:sulfotransferase domain-containing protein [Alphaproteobacteria bacterium]NCQ88532.1 sulfotransferase domain-containing protein [Alphaproteobacteria bacterium]NCT06075.1 sulfotransferase domain-containing protein [Alphaproteobacteria bacterium]